MEPIDELMARIRRDFPKPERAESPAPSSKSNDMPGDPDCPICHGIGWVARDLPVGDPDFGRMTPCTCRSKKIAEAKEIFRTADSNIDSYSKMTFETFNPKGRGNLRPEEETCLQFALKTAQNFAEKPDGWLLFAGNYGTGKTHLAAAIAHRALELGISNIFQPVPDLLDMLRASYGNTTESYDERFEHIRNVPLLILDDFGTQSSTPWAEEKLYQLLNYRYVKLLPTVITTNVSKNEMDGRIASRLKDPSLVVTVYMNAPDYRDPLTMTSTSDISILHLLQNRTFENFEMRRSEKLSQEASRQLKEAFDAARTFARDPQGWLILAGPSGIGKTHLAAAIGNYRKETLMENPLFITASDLLDHLRATFRPNNDVTYDTMFEEVRNTPLLILNYLDTMNATPWACEKMYQILNYRYQAQMPTVITLIKPIKEIDPNIRSRLVDTKISRVVQMFDVPMYNLNRNVELPDREKKSAKTNRP